MEDDDLHADVLRMVLDQLGYELIDVVDNHADALRLLGAARPDVLLMDIDLGGEETGIDLVRKVNEMADVPTFRGPASTTASCPTSKPPALTWCCPACPTWKASWPCPCW